MNKVLFVASGMEKPKRRSSVYKIESLYLNYGLLGLATNLKVRTGLESRMFQGDYNSVEYTLFEVEQEFNLSEYSYPMFISVPSFISVSWAVNFIELIKSKYPSIKVVLGGRWVIDSNLKWAKDKFPLVDYFSLGTPDDSIELLLDSENWTKEINTEYKHPFYNLDYRILHNFKQYQPVIEVQRGCGRGCFFCLESKHRQTKLRTPVEVIGEMKSLVELYSQHELNIYFESSMFAPTVEWSIEFVELYQKANLQARWRMTTRVDTINPQSLKILSKGGLYVVDLGLESASPTQLLKMNKTKAPEKYLSKALEVLNECKQSNVLSKINILLYLEETEETFTETVSWLETHKDLYYGLSVNSFYLYLNGEVDTQDWSWVEEVDTRTTGYIDREIYIDTGYYRPRLSKTIDLQRASQMEEYITQTFMNREKFEYLKSICYTKNGG